MDTFDNYRQLLACSMRLPVFSLRRGKPAGGSQPQTAELLLFGRTNWDALPKAPGQSGTAQYLRSAYEECFIYLPLAPLREFWVGPLLTQKLDTQRISAMIRHQKLPISSRERLLNHYSALPVLTENQYYHAGQLCEMVLAGTRPLADGPPPADARRARPVFSERRARQRQEMFAHPPYFMELEMARLVTTGDLNGAISAMNRINTFQRAVLAREPVRSLKNSLICDCTFLARAAIAGGVSPEDAFALSDELILHTEDTTGIKELEHQQRHILMAFVELVHTYNTSHYSKPVRDAVGYLNNNLSEKVTLPMLAAQVGLHPNYLSTLFKRETGLSFTQYLQRRRIEEAKFFLRYSTSSISEIAAFFQFSSQSHFIQCFVKAEGLTPLQFRKQAAGQLPQSG